MHDVRELDGATWHKSSYSNAQGGQCVEHGRLRTGRQAVRDTKDQGQGTVVFDAMAWRSFVNGVRSDVS